MQDMDTIQSNLQDDQQFNEEIQGITLMDTLHEEAITDANKLGTKYVQLNSKEVVITQLVLASIITNEQTDATNQHSSTCMLVEYGAPRLVSETNIDLTQPNDGKYGFFSTFGFYNEEVKMEYFSKHGDSMETQLVELVHALAKKVKDVKWSYGGKI